ncbi:MAG: shikimate dehydrogenase family protein [Thermoprotei archaeon]
MTKLLGLVGSDLARSPSALIHNYLFKKNGIDAVYRAFQLDASEFSERFPVLVQRAFGLNVTMPFKEDAARHLRELVGEAKLLGAVNTVKEGDGYNTDYLAVRELLKEKGIRPKTCLLIGAGGAAKAASLALINMGCQLNIYDRTPERARAFAEQLSSLGYTASVVGNLAEADLVVNAVPVFFPLSYRPRVYIDFSYLRDASLGSEINIGGDEILVRQAIKSDLIWFNKINADEKEVLQFARKLIRRSL